MSPLRWISKSIRALTVALREKGHQVSDFVVRRLLRERGYSLQGNIKLAEDGQHEDRDAQFGYLNDQAQTYLVSGDPVISVDAKKKVLVGAYKNGGREWHPGGQPEQVKVHDFIDPQLGKVIPYGAGKTVGAHRLSVRCGLQTGLYHGDGPHQRARWQVRHRAAPHPQRRHLVPRLGPDPHPDLGRGDPQTRAAGR